MDFFKIKNSLLVGKDTFVSGNLFVSGKILSSESVLDGGNPDTDYSNESTINNAY